MTKTLRLNDLQLVLLSNAAAKDNGSLMLLPESYREDTTRIGKAVTSLLKRKLIEELPVTDRSLAGREEDQDMIGLFITAAGRVAIGASDVEQTTQTASSEVAAAEVRECASGDEAEAAQHAANTGETAPPRPGSKIAAVVTLLEREEGATLDEMVEATGWLPHTTRAALTGLRKKGRMIDKAKRGDVTCYRIAAEG